MSAENALSTDRFEAMRRGLSNAWDTIDRQQRTIDDLRERVERLEVAAFDGGELDGEPVTSDAEDSIVGSMETRNSRQPTGEDDG